jgi:hypothetical protein
VRAEGEVRTPAGRHRWRWIKSGKHHKRREQLSTPVGGTARSMLRYLRRCRLQIVGKRSANSEKSDFLAICGATARLATQAVSYRLQGVAKSVTGDDDGARVILGRSSDVSMGASGCAGRVHRAKSAASSPKWESGATSRVRGSDPASVSRLGSCGAVLPSELGERSACGVGHAEFPQQRGQGSMPLALPR